MCRGSGYRAVWRPLGRSHGGGGGSQPLRTRTKKRTNAKLGLGSITREPWARPCRTNSGRICSPSARLCPRTRMVQNIAMCAPSKALTSTPKARRDKPRTDQSSSGRPCASRRARAASTERTRLARSAGLRASRSRLASKIWSAVLTASSTCARPVAAVDSLRAIEQRSARALPLPSLALGLSGCAILPSHTVQPTLSRRGQIHALTWTSAMRARSVRTRSSVAASRGNSQSQHGPRARGTTISLTAAGSERLRPGTQGRAPSGARGRDASRPEAFDTEPHTRKRRVEQGRTAGSLPIGCTGEEGKRVGVDQHASALGDDRKLPIGRVLARNFRRALRHRWVEGRGLLRAAGSSAEHSGCPQPLFASRRAL